MNEGSFIIKGDFCWSKSLTVLETRPGAFLVCVEGKSAGVFPRVPEQYAGLPLVDYSDKLIVPGLADLHIHAPQFSFRGLGMDKELLDWLETRAFPEEVKYRNIEYARKSYGFLIEHLKRGPNTRIVFFATVHTAATLLLMDMLEESGLVCLAGKVNMDRNSPTNLSEENAAASLAATRDWLDKCSAYKNVRPILTPRFIPSCSDGLMEGLGKLQREFNLPVQSHLSENHKEIEWVKKLHPDISGYGAVYDRFGLFGHSPAEAGAPAVMAHCVHSDEKEIALLSERQVYIAHCPQSNTNLSSGIAPVRHFLEAGIPVGLGSDIAGGIHSSIFRAMADAVQVSKLRRALINSEEKPLTIEEVFYLGTVGGHSFFKDCGFGNSGSFDPGNDFDALVIDDAEPALGYQPAELSIKERLERAIYLSDDRHIKAKFVRGSAGGINCGVIFSPRR